MKKRALLSTIVALELLSMPCNTCGQSSVGIAYYDLDRLYDTLPALFYDDAAYTPAGRLAWNTERYRRKVRHTAAVLDSMRMPLAALCGVENEAVVRDLVAASVQDYSYVHRTLNSLTGMDFALLYYGDVFFPDHIDAGRSYLYVEGQLLTPSPRRSAPGPRAAKPRPRGERIGLLLSNDTRYAEWALRDLRAERPGVKLLVLGRNATVSCGKLGLCDCMRHATKAGRGNVRHRSEWRMRDRILADTALRCAGGEAYARRFLFDGRSGRPLPTFEKEAYRGGYSNALPVFIYLK